MTSPHWLRLLEVLEAHPEARLNALDEQGLFVALPPALRAFGREQRIARSGIEHVDPVDHGTAITAWLEAFESGYGEAEVRELDTPQDLTRLYFVDLRAEYGVIAAAAHLVTRHPVQGRPATAAEPPRLGHTRKDAGATFLALDAGAEQMMGVPAGALVGTPSRERVHPDDRALAVSSWVELLSSPGSTLRVRLRLLRADDSWFWADMINHNLLADPAYGCVVGDLIDVSREMALREDVRTRERLLQRLTEALPVGLVQVAPDGTVVYANDRFHRMLGVAPQATLLPQLATIDAADRPRLAEAFERAMRTQQDEALQVAAAGDAAVCAVELRPLVDDAGVTEGVLGCFTDVTEAVRLRAELEQQASHDALTGCLNRAAVVRRLRRDLAEVAPAHGCAVLFLDLDDFKLVNDTQGHAAGDRVLREVSEVLRSAARTDDAVGRLGGDEFVLVCPGVASEDAALLLAVDIGARLRERGAAVGASTGVTWVQDPDTDADAVLARADAAMYHAKQSGLDLPVLWRPTMQSV